MRLVLDCNVVIAAGRTVGTCRQAVLAALTGHEVLLSEPILAEYRDVASRPKHASYREVLDGLIERIMAMAVLVEPPRAPIVFQIPTTRSISRPLWPAMPTPSSRAIGATFQPVTLAPLRF